MNWQVWRVPSYQTSVFVIIASVADLPKGRSRSSRHRTFCKQLDHVIGQAIVKKLLEGPGELGALKIPFGQSNAVFGRQDIRKAGTDAQLDAVALLFSGKVEERVFVFLKLFPHSFQRAHL